MKKAAGSLLLASCCFLAWITLVPPKYQLTAIGLDGILSQKIELFRNTTVRTSNPALLLSTSSELLTDEAY
jgi:hypothetical protein